MNLEEIQALLTVADHGSFVAAAREGTMTRSTLRRRIDELEARIGMPLFQRTPNGARLTAVGEAVVREGRQLIEHARALMQAARAAGPATSRPLVIAMPLGLPTEVLAFTYHGMAKRFPWMPLHVSFSENPRAALAEGADLVVAIDGETADGPWVRLRLRRMAERLKASRTYLARAGRPSTLDELLAHPIAMWRGPGRDGAALPLRAGGTLPLEARVVTGDAHLLYHIAAAGAAISYVPDAFVGALLPIERDLEPVLPDLVGRDTAMDLLVPTSLVEEPHIRAVLDAARQIFGLADATPRPERTG